METQEKKQPNMKLSKTMMIAGASVLALGVVLLIIAIIKIVQDKRVYDAEYDAWYDVWWGNPSSGVTLNDKPNMNLSGLPLVFVSLFLMSAGFVVLFIGARPYITKFALKHHKETLDYAGEDITNIGTKMVDIGAPIAKKATKDVVAPMANTIVDDVVAPAVSKIKKAIVEDKPVAESTTNYAYCRHCGKKIVADSKFCNHCGEQQ